MPRVARLDDVEDGVDAERADGAARGAVPADCPVGAVRAEGQWLRAGHRARRVLGGARCPVAGWGARRRDVAALGRAEERVRAERGGRARDAVRGGLEVEGAVAAVGDFFGTGERAGAVLGRARREAGGATRWREVAGFQDTRCRVPAEGRVRACGGTARHLVGVAARAVGHHLRAAGRARAALGGAAGVAGRQQGGQHGRGKGVGRDDSVAGHRVGAGGDAGQVDVAAVGEPPEMPVAGWNVPPLQTVVPLTVTVTFDAAVGRDTELTGGARGAEPGAP